MKPVVAIVLSWNHQRAVLESIARLERTRGAPVEVVVVDNASSDDSVAVIRDAHPTVTVLEQPVNRGFAGGVNAGLAEAERRGADHAWLINDDTVFDDHVVAALVEHAAAHPEAGLLSPTLHDLAPGGGVQFVNGLVDWARGTMSHNLRADQYRARSTADATPVLPGTALLVDLRVYRAIGPFDERFFAYWEDTDYSVRAARAGFATGVVDEAVVSHAAPRIVDRPPHYHYYMTRNEALFWSLHAVAPDRRRWRRRWLAASLEAIGLHRDLGHAAHVRAIVDALWHVVRRCDGPRDLHREAPAVFHALVSTYPYVLARLVLGDVAGITRRLARRR